MERATISQVKNHLSSYIRKVRAGQSILILDRDHPVARIEPVTIEDDPEGRLASMAREGLLKLPTQPVPIKMLKSATPIRVTGVLEALLEERRTGR
jgi:antitoxin (DNA-binding transcriptional repressor) of toxin-antitoxin stability system